VQADAAIVRLFVYGTLRAGSAHPMASFLAARARLLGGASCAGRLLDLGEYPGLVDDDDPRQRVAGELWELDAPAAPTLAALDEYEGCAEGLFERVRREVRGVGVPGEGPAWVYLHRGRSAAPSAAAE
jgi:gamma-glutamylcyclotransferase (GGCT)/AIG2-like uncharacterized protein YtfP